MAAQALREALAACPPPASLDLLAAATAGPGVSMPGFANVVQGEACLPPLKTASLAGVCASSVSALDVGVSEIELGRARRAAVVAAEFPSRLFKRSRLCRARELSFDAHFLRWMLSDAAGAWILGDGPNCLGEGLHAYRFLEYHGQNDLDHMKRWVQAVELALAVDASLARDILQVARSTASLYALSWQHALGG